jgi:ferric-chelate reductase (NADPH)
MSSAGMGRFENAVLSLFTKQARVTSLEHVADAFTRVTLAGDALRGVAWTPGQKLQIAVKGFTQRTFTPILWDATEGSTELLVYAHSEGAVARWIGTLEVGASCSLFGPRSSLDLDSVGRPALLFGDETSFGLARALASTTRGTADVPLLFEVSSRSASEQALTAIGIRGAELVERRVDDAHLDELETTVETLVRRSSIQGAVLSGKATTLRAVSRRLRDLGLSRAQIRTKAYWAPGKSGLD